MVSQKQGILWNLILIFQTNFFKSSAFLLFLVSPLANYVTLLSSHLFSSFSHFSSLSFLPSLSFLTNLQWSYIRNSKGICCIIWLRKFSKFENHFECLLNLSLFRKSIPGNSFFYLKWGILDHWNTVSSKCMKHHSSGMGNLNPIGNISKKKKLFYTTKYRLIGFDQSLKILSNLYKTFWKRKARLRFDHTVFDNTKVPPFLFYQGKSSCRGSRIKSKYEHKK